MSGASVGPGEKWLVLLLAIGLTWFWTRPWLRHIATVMPDPAAVGNLAGGADARLIIWLLAWDAHALATAPLSLFDANIFHPAGDMLTGSEVMLSSALLAAPVYWIGGNALLAANLLAIASYALAFVAAWWALRSYGYQPAPCAIAAAAFALGPFRTPPDLHVIQYPNFWLPLVLIAAGLARRGRARWLVLTLLLALFTSYYLGAMVLLLLAVETLLALVAGDRRGAARMVASALPGALAIALFSVPYMARSRDFPSAEGTLGPLASIGAYFQGAVLDPSNPLVGVGYGMAGLGLLGLVSPLLRGQRPSAKWWRWVSIALTGLLLGLGPTLDLGAVEVPLPYGLALDTPLRVLRAFPRFLILAHLGVVGLAAEGAAVALAALRRWWPSSAAAAMASLVLFLAVTVPLSMRMSEARFTVLPIGAHRPPVYDALAQRPPGPLLEVPGPGPVYALGRKAIQGEFMVTSTEHWRPLLGGHTGYPPWWWKAWLMLEVERLPDPVALANVVDATGVRWIIVHREHAGRVKWEEWRAAMARGELSGREIDGHLLIRVERPPRPSWVAALARGEGAPGRTLLGTKLEPIPAAAAAGRLRSLVDGSLGPVRPGAPVPLLVEVRNEGTATWPVLIHPDAPEGGLVGLRATWRAGDGRSVPRSAWSRLRYDLAPGARDAVPLEITSPDAPGDYALELRLEQKGGAPFAETPPLRFTVRVVAADPARGERPVLPPFARR